MIFRLAVVESAMAPARHLPLLSPNPPAPLSPQIWLSLPNLLPTLVFPSPLSFLLRSHLS
jgi:hypothetical protein